MQNINNEYVGFLKAYKLYWKNYFNFEGHSSRSEYWWTFLWNFIIGIIEFLLMIKPIMTIFARSYHRHFTLDLIPKSFWIIFIIMLIWGLINIIPGIALTVRRFHDIGISGWWYVVTPVIASILYDDQAKDTTGLILRIIGIILQLILLYLLIKGPKRDNNKYVE